MTIVGLALPFDFEQPVWLWLCLIVPLLIAASIRSLAGLSPIRRALAVTARSFVVILVASCLAGIQHVQRTDDLTVLFLMDRSHSVQEQQDFQEQYIAEAARGMASEDRVGLIDFARNAFLQQLPMSGGYHIEPGRLPPMPNTDRTDIASAMRLAMAMFPHDTAKRIVLMSDGNDNMGDLLTEARRAKADGIPVDVVPIYYKHRNEVYFDRMIAPTHAEPGEQVPLRMVLNSHKAVAGTITMYLNGELVDLPEEAARVHLNPGSNTLFMKMPIQRSGAQTYEAIFHPDNEEMDTIALNNAASAFTFVSGTSFVLILSSNPSHDQPLADALASENVRVEMRNVSELGAFDLLHMMNYSTIILANVPAATFTDEQQEALAVYVKDMGSGLIMFGGDESFGAGGWIGSPVEEIMPVSFEIKHKRVIPRGALVLIMHSCEIPRGNYWGKEMAKKSVDTISSQDYIGVLAYTYSPGGENWEVPLDLNLNKAAVKAKIDRMQIGDMPDFGTTMQMAFNSLTSGRGSDAAQKHVIILSDGDAQPPSGRLVNKYVQAKITVSTISIGWGGHVMDRALRDIAKKTGGKYYAARNPRQLPQIFSKESKVVRRPLIIDEPFQPQVLHMYSDLLTGIDPQSDALPPLGGMVLTSPKHSPNVLVPIIRATDDGEDPVLAHWQYELGKAVAFTSGYWPKWGTAWTEWPKFAKLWAQIVRWTMRQDTPANFDTYTRVEGNRARIVIDALDKDAGYLNNLQLRTKAIGPDNSAIPLQFTQTGPGKYEAQVEVEKAGQHLANVQVADGTRNLGTIRTGFSVPFSPEYRDLIPNEALLRQVVDTTEGRWLDAGPAHDDVFNHDLPPTLAKRSAWEWVLAWLLLPLFLLDVAVRRLASWLALSVAVEIVVLFVLLYGIGIAYGPWWGILGAFALAELIGWTIRFRFIGPLFDFMTHSVTALSRTGERSAASLDQLKTTREQVRDELSSAKEEGLKRIDQEPGPIPLASARRRFDTGGHSAEPAGDLDQALDGAKVTEPPPDKRRPPPPVSKEDQEETTSRLLRKKRKREEEKE
ncbi:MAG: VWA domain-containing protein [Phycisphaerales bacterium]|nr:MAG: VWA domain-containing protein [Phycisphaerales bacterium]